jgi:glycine cleavage system aminomethyltransferase T
MPMAIEGPDAQIVVRRRLSLRLCGRQGRAIRSPSRGYVIGDAILFHLDENLYNVVGRASVHNWLQCQLKQAATT